MNECMSRIRSRNCLFCNRTSEGKICSNCKKKFHAAVDIIFHSGGIEYNKTKLTQIFFNDIIIKNNIKILEERGIKYEYTDYDICMFLYNKGYDKIYLSLIFGVKESRIYCNL